MNVTIYDIAKKAGVSAATVSRALSHDARGKVANKTLENIEGLVKEFAYTPNITARNLRTKFFYTIGVILPHFKGIFQNDYYMNILAGISDALLETKYNFKTIILKKVQNCKDCDACGLVCPVEKNPEKAGWDTYNFRAGEGIDGLIVTQWPMFFSDKSFPEKSDIPYVIINDPDEDLKLDSVSCDDYMGGSIAAEYLLGKGHKKIAVINGPEWSTGSKLRFKGFKDMLTKSNIHLDNEVIVSGNYQQEQAGTAVEKILAKRKDITAIFCLNDEMAVGVLLKLEELEIPCPDKISVIGFDNRSGIPNNKYQITTVNQPVEKIARTAVSVLLGSINTMRYGKKWKNRDFQRKKVVVNLVERQTVRSL